MYVVTPEQMMDIDRQTISEFGLDAQVLMESAARSCLDFVPKGSIVILVGPGNNGGDGLVLARALAELGRKVLVLQAYAKLGTQAQLQLERAQTWGVPVIEAFQSPLPTSTTEALERADVIIDALFGTGLARAVEPTCSELVRLANDSRAQRIAIDMPSGIHGETGQILGSAFFAHKTVTFGLRKWGQLVYPGKKHCGELHLTQPGFHPESLSSYPQVQLLDSALAAKWLPSSDSQDHKGSNGRLLLCTGSETYPGAGALSCLGAIRGGAGLTTLYSSPSSRSLSLALSPEVIPMSREQEVDPKEFDAVVLGCGLGEETNTVGRKTLSRCQAPTVLDADALTLLQETPLESRRHLVLTPHPGELARMLQCSVESLESDRIGSAIRAAETLQAVVCFKGSPTITACPDGKAWINSTGNSVLAQGGTGDLLAGLIGAYLAFGLELEKATATAAYIHGLASDLAAAELGPRGIPAHIISEYIPRAHRATCRDNL